MNGEGDDWVEGVPASYRPVDATEVADVARLRSAMKAGDVYARTTPMHVTGSAIVVHLPTRRVLLRWHPRMQLWMQVGGHFDAGERDPLAVALREAQEETGLGDLRSLTPGPVQVVIVPVPAFGDEPAHEHADVRYVLTTGTPEAIVAESDAARLRWLALDEARGEIHEDNLRELLDRAARIL
jgi:8-oxo-dGTP pyrophosphatase MutT (NUDIX family)